MATTDDLIGLGFTPSVVEAVTLNLTHPDPFSMGPFCRLRVQTTAPPESGVYAWVAGGQVCYVGKAVEGFGLVQKVNGQRLGRAYDDYTYCPPSKALKKSQTRARVNGLLNASLVKGQVVEWWWLVASNAKWRLREPLGTLRISPDDAENLGLVAGDVAKVTTSRGSARATVEIDDRFRSGSRSPAQRLRPRPDTGRRKHRARRSGTQRPHRRHAPGSNCQQPLAQVPARQN